VSLAAISALGSAAQISPATSLGSAGSVSSGTTAATDSSGFGNALTQAINSLDQSQSTASTAATQLATGKSTDTVTAVTDVENAQLEMELASQITSKTLSAVQTIFQTQV